jgi:histidinol-phosphate aminotransferase
VTDWERLARPSLRGLERYDPGPTRDALKQRHGLGELEPLNWNEDLFGPPSYVLEAATAELRNVQFYPERAYADFRERLAEWLDVPDGYVVPAHGAQALIGTVATTFIEPGTPVVVPQLTYGLYAQVSAAAGAAITRVPPAGLHVDLDGMADAARATGARLVWLCDPNNPTGSLITPAAWRSVLDRLPGDCVVIADEAYIDFAEPARRAHRLSDVMDGRPVIVVRSFSKIFGLAGLRLGYAVADPQVGRLLDIVQEPFNVNRVALAAGRAALSRPEFVAARRAEVAAARALLRDELANAGIRTHPSDANFVLVELGVDDRPVCDALLLAGVLVRGGREFGLPGFARVTVAPEPAMRRAAHQIVAAITAAEVSMP